MSHDNRITSSLTAPRRSTGLTQANPGATGFTLIELLVVITIIVVLLALLTPALDKAIYQAELVVCGTNLKGIANGSALYAAENKRSYFFRQGVEQAGSAWRPQWLATPRDSATGGKIDHRRLMRNHINMQNFGDPLAGDVRWGIEETHDASYVDPPVVLFAGFKYAGNAGLMKLGRAWTYNNKRFNVIATDADFRQGPAGSGGQQFSSHPDSDGIMVLDTKQDESVSGVKGGSAYTDTHTTAGGGLIFQYVLTRWFSTGQNPGRGTCDYNYGFIDSSVSRLTDVVEDDPRVENVPYWASGPSTRNDAAHWRYYVPAN